MAVHKGGEQQTRGEIDGGLEKVDGVKPCAGPEAREKHFKYGEEDGIARQAVRCWRDIVTGAKAVDACMQQIVAELEIVERVVVKGGRKHNKGEAQDESQSNPDDPAARPAQSTERREHAWRI